MAEPKRNILTPKSVADEILQQDHFAQDGGGKLYHFAGGCYRPRAEDFVKRHVKRLAGEQWKRSLGDEVCEYIRLDSPELWERPPIDIVNVSNGLLSIGTRELAPHNPEYLSPVQLPVTYDRQATCPATDQFIKEVFPRDSERLAWEIPGWLMVPDTSKQKAILLLGEGGNGKSTWLAQLVALLGQRNTSALSLHKIESDKFAVARLVGKLANIHPDLPSDHLQGTSVFKAITGGDPITAEHKFRDSFDFVPYCRLVFSANHPPRSDDSSSAFFDRWVVIPFEGRFRGTAQEIARAELDRRLSSPRELSGLLNHALDAVKWMAEQAGRFTLKESVRAAWHEFHATTDPLTVWLDQFTVDGTEALVPCDTLRAAYNAHCDQHGRPRLGDRAFGNGIRRARPNIERRQRNYGGRPKAYCYVGIGLLDQQNESPDSPDSPHKPYFVSRRREDSNKSEQSKGYPVKGVKGVTGDGSKSDQEVTPLDTTTTSDDHERIMSDDFWDATPAST